VDYNNLSVEERESLKKEFNMTDEQLDAEINKINDDPENPNIPTPPNKDDVLKFLRDVFSIKSEENLKMNRSGNLNNVELGNLVFSVRRYNDLGNYAELAGYNGFSAYSRNKTSNIITTSTSKKGFLLQLITTTKKISKNIGAKRVSKQSSLWGGTKETVEGGEEE